MAPCKVTARCSAWPDRRRPARRAPRTNSRRRAKPCPQHRCPIRSTPSWSAPGPAVPHSPECWPRTATNRSCCSKPARTTAPTPTAVGRPTCSTPRTSRSPTTTTWSGWPRSGRVLDLPRAKVVGGCSSHNGCTASLSARADYDDWARQGNPGWDAATVEPLLTWVRDRFRVRRYRMGELTSAQAAFVHAGLAVGLPFADDLDDIEAGRRHRPDAGQHRRRDPLERRVRVPGPGTRSGEPDHRRRHLPSGACCSSGRQVTGVEVDGPDGPQIIRAARVVVAGGAYHSPALLLRSGIGPAAELHGAGHRRRRRPARSRSAPARPRLRRTALPRQGRAARGTGREGMESRRADRGPSPIQPVRRRAVRHPRLHGRRREQRPPRPAADQPVRRGDAGQVGRGRDHPQRRPVGRARTSTTATAPTPRATTAPC